MSSDVSQRKLAAILAADVVGYSRLMAADEEGTVGRLRVYREIIDGLIVSHHGRVFGTAGDSVIAEFASPVEAVRCAIEMQRQLEYGNAELVEDHRMRFRIGINLGDVVVEAGNLLGDGVNLAARLEMLAEPGGICISANIHEHVRPKLELAYDDLGEQAVKNIPEPVRVYALRLDGGSRRRRHPARRKRSRLRVALATVAGLLLFIGVGTWATWPQPLGLLIDVVGLSGPPINPPLPDRPSIVVLPFTNMSGDPEQEYFSDGITEDLTTELARHRHLFVISRNSAFTYKGEPVNVQEVGRELGVRYVLEGSVRKAADRIRITAQLIDATTDGHLWSGRYDRELSDIFAIQSEIAEEILGNVDVEIIAAEHQRLARKRPQDFTAVDAVWRGRYLFLRYIREDMEEARRLFERAIELDPHHPQAATVYALLGNTYWAELASGWSSDTALLDRAEMFGRRAVELDDSNPYGHETLAQVNFFRGRTAEAIMSARRALELNPNNAGAHGIVGMALAQGGRLIEATQSIKRALRLEPHPGAGRLMTVAYVNLAAGRRDEAMTVLERVRMAYPDNIVVRVPLAAHYENEGRHEEAVAVVRETLRVRPDLTAKEAMQLVPGLEAITDADEFARYSDVLRSAGLP